MQCFGNALRVVCGIGPAPASVRGASERANKAVEEQPISPRMMKIGAILAEFFSNCQSFWFVMQIPEGVGAKHGRSTRTDGRPTVGGPSQAPSGSPAGVGIGSTPRLKPDRLSHPGAKRTSGGVAPGSLYRRDREERQGAPVEFKTGWWRPGGAPGPWRSSRGGQVGPGHCTDGYPRPCLTTARPRRTGAP